MTVVPNRAGQSMATAQSAVHDPKLHSSGLREGWPLFSQYFGGPEGTNGPVYVGAIILALALLGAALTTSG